MVGNRLGGGAFCELVEPEAARARGSRKPLLRIFDFALVESRLRIAISKVLFNPLIELLASEQETDARVILGVLFPHSRAREATPKHLSRAFVSPWGIDGQR